MLNSKMIGRAAWAIAAALLAVGSTAFAHTTIKAQATEGVSDDNALKIGHGCETPDGDHIPVIAQSVVFPSASPEISTSDGSVITDLSQVIEQGSIAGLLKPIQDKSIFRSQRVKFDDLENVIGFSAINGSLNVDTPGRVPFQFTAPKFVTTTCAKRLLIKIAVADVCLVGLNAADSLQAGKVNVWIPANGSKYATALAGFDGIGAPATLTVNRNLTTNPLGAACGAGIDVTVSPSAADIEANLPIPQYWP